MGLATERFIDSLSEHFLCGVCLDVVLKPMMFTKCEHIFCDACVKGFYVDGAIACPYDRVPMYEELKIVCSHYPECESVISVQELEQHERTCSFATSTQLFDPEIVAFCPKGCGMQLKLSSMSNHHCEQFFWDRIEKLEEENRVLVRENAQLLEDNLNLMRL